MLQELPTEILIKIYDHLSINDVTSLDIACRWEDYNSEFGGYGINMSGDPIAKARIRKFRKLYEDRISARLYLGHSFRDAEGLIKTMLMNDIYLSGSRALEFFVPGSTDENSDWDFYANSETGNVFRFMEFVKTTGVKWLTCMEWFTQKLENSQHTSGITVKQIGDLHSIVMSNESNDTVSDAIRKLGSSFGSDDQTDAMEATITVKNSKGDDKCFIIRHDIYSRFDIIYGTFEHHGRNERIQLMVGTKGLQTIMEFYTSALQCVITGFCAAHMYAKDAYMKRSILWCTDVEGHPTEQHKITQSKAKYRRRGFTFYNKDYRNLPYSYQSNVSIKRHLKDSESHVIDHKFAMNSSPRSRAVNEMMYRYISAKRSKFYEFSWIEYGKNLMVCDYHHQEKRDTMLSSVRTLLEDINDDDIPDTDVPQYFIDKARDLNMYDDEPNIVDRFRALQPTGPEDFLFEYLPMRSRRGRRNILVSR